MRLGQLQCISAHPTWLILWGRIVGTNQTDSNGILKVLQEWSDEESKVVIEGVHLKTLTFCLVNLKEGEPPYCEVPTEPPSSQNVDPDPTETSPITYVIVGVVVIMLVMITVVLVCIVTVSFCKKKRVRDRRLRCVYSN